MNSQPQVKEEAHLSHLISSFLTWLCLFGTFLTDFSPDPRIGHFLPIQKPFNPSFVYYLFLLKVGTLRLREKKIWNVPWQTSQKKTKDSTIENANKSPGQPRKREAATTTLKENLSLKETSTLNLKHTELSTDNPRITGLPVQHDWVISNGNNHEGNIQRELSRTSEQRR